MKEVAANDAVLNEGSGHEEGVAIDGAEQTLSLEHNKEEFSAAAMSQSEMELQDPKQKRFVPPEDLRPTTKGCHSGQLQYSDSHERITTINDTPRPSPAPSTPSPSALFPGLGSHPLSTKRMRQESNTPNKDNTKRLKHTDNESTRFHLPHPQCNTPSPISQSTNTDLLVSPLTRTRRPNMTFFNRLTPNFLRDLAEHHNAPSAPRFKHETATFNLTQCSNQYTARHYYRDYRVDAGWV